MKTNQNKIENSMPRSRAGLNLAKSAMETGRTAAVRQHRSLPNARSGLITWGTLLSLLLLMILVALVSNVAIVVNRKMEIQNSADAIAYSSSVWVARGMNSLSATNHVIGEMNALFTVHHALGGKWLDKHHSSKKRNSGDSAWTLPASLPFGLGGYGGIWYQVTNLSLFITYWSANISHYITEFLSWLPPWVGNGPGLNSNHYDRVKKHPIADINSAIWEGKEHLKNQMVAAYSMHAAGSSMYIQGFITFYTPDSYGPIVVPPPLNFRNMAKGYKMMKNGASTKKAARKWQDAIHAQYLVLDKVEAFAISIAPAKLAIPDIIKVVYTYQQACVKVEIPTKAYLTAKNIGKRTKCTGFALGDIPGIPSSGVLEIGSELTKFFPSLPVEPEKVANEGRSQMVRATYPWVRKWRYNINLVFTTLAPTSQANDGFIKWTNKYAKQSSQWLRTDTGKKCDNELTVINRRRRSTGENGKGIRLYTIYELNQQGDKSQEVWNKKGFAGSKKADEIFCCMGFAKSDKPTVLSRQFFRQENPNGIVCYSQAMIYNANSQQTPATGGKDQPAVGWDTLAWDHDKQRVKEWEDPGYFARMFGSFLPDKEPKIKLNWQAKLTPVTVNKMLKTIPGAMVMDSDVRKVLMNAREAQLLLQNH
jgi:hypothetical protein